MLSNRPLLRNLDSFLVYASDTDSAPNTAGVQELPVEIGSGFAVLKAVSPFAARGTPAASDSGRGVWILYHRWKMWLGVVSGAPLRVEVMKLLGRGIVVGDAGSTGYGGGNLETYMV